MRINNCRITWVQDFVLYFVAVNVGLATFEILKMSVGEYGDGVNDDGDGKGEHPANNHRNFDYPVDVYVIL